MEKKNEENANMKKNWAGELQNCSFLIAVRRFTVQEEAFRRLRREGDSITGDSYGVQKTVIRL